MKLVSTHVTNYKSITDSGSFRIEPDVTTLVGKNESGKSAFLEALYRINPVPSGVRSAFDALYDYPRGRYNIDRPEIPDIEPIGVEFELEESDIRVVEDRFGRGVFRSHIITVRKNYSGTRHWTLRLNEDAVASQMASDAHLGSDVANSIHTLLELRGALEATEDLSEAAQEILDGLDDFNLHTEVRNLLIPRLPKFIYFGEYSTLPGRFSIPYLQSTSEAEFNSGERTALSLLRLARVEHEEFLETNYEARRAALEAAANQITDEVFEYWSQNENLRVDFDADFTSPADPHNPGKRPPFLDIRIYNARHRISLNFGERSTGFVWFFSFLAYFSEFRDSEEKLILLLDEPGLGLHGTAQGDLLRFIDDRLAPDHQVIYTTHSPFLVNPAKLDRARTVEDKDREGTKISEEVLSVSRDTLFPLQASLGYQLSQTLFVGHDNLIVEGPSDILYLQILSTHLRSQGRTALDPRWVLVPAGGVDNIPTFVALLGTELNLAVLLDVTARGTQKVDSMVARGILKRSKLFPLTEITGTKEADIEDLFDPGFYLELLRGAGTANLRVKDLGQEPRILRRAENNIGHKFDHYQPAAYFQREQARLIDKLSAKTLDRFESLFEKVNTAL